MENEKISINQNGLEKLLEKSLANFEEERDLALDRYRRQDEAMVSNDDFVLQGKNTSEYLKIAADRSNAVFSIAKLYKEILFKDDGKQSGGGGGVSDSEKKEILDLIKQNKLE